MAARRPVDQRVADLNKKIESLQSSIAALEAKKDAILNPKPRTTAKTVLDLAKKAGMKPEEMLAKLGLTIDD